MTTTQLLIYGLWRAANINTADYDELTDFDIAKAVFEFKEWRKK